MEDYREKILTREETRRSFLDRLAKVTAGALVGAAAPKVIEARRSSEDVSSGKSYFIDAQLGDDEATGESADTAFKSLEKVWRLLKPGDTVYLHGTFVGQDLRSAVSGTADKPITFTSLGSEKATIDRGRNGGLIYLEGTPDNPLSNIIVKNLRLTNSDYKETDAPAMVGVHLQNTEGVTIEACETEHVGTLIENSRQFKIRNNTIEKVAAFDSEGRPYNEYHAIRISGSDYGEVAYNKFAYGGHCLIEVEGYEKPSLYNTIVNNKIFNPWGTGIYPGAGAMGTLVANNDIWGIGLEPALVRATGLPTAPENVGPAIGIRGGGPGKDEGNIVYANRIHHVAGNGITLDGFYYPYKDSVITNQAINNLIDGNIIYKAGKTAIHFGVDLSTVDIAKGRPQPQVRGNRLTRNIVSDCNGWLAKDGSKLWTSEIDIAFYREAQRWGRGSMNYNRIHDNVFWSSRDSAEHSFMTLQVPGTFEFYRMLEEAQQVFSTEMYGNVWTDPRFVNPASGDFDLAADSPLIKLGYMLP